MRIAYAAGWMMLAFAGVVFALSGIRWRQGLSQDGIPEHLRINELRMSDHRADRSGQDAVSPLTQQAIAFSLYLKPPAPPAPRELPRSRPVAQSAPRPPTVAPKFVLLSTSCHRSCPERSLALVSEPGKGGYWVAQGERVGHLLVENIKDGAIVCRDGSQLREVTVVMKETAPLAQPKAGVPIAMQSTRPDVRSMNVLQLAERGTGIPNARPIADEAVD